MARFCLVDRRNLSLYAIFQLKFRRREVCLFFVAADSVSVLARQRVAQASQAEFCCGQEFKWHPDCALGMPRDLLRRLYMLAVIS
jgi:hypothetical protein